MSQRWLIVAADFVTTGGMDRANHALAGHLARRGDEVHLVSHRVSEDLLALPGTVPHLAPRPLGKAALGDYVLGPKAARLARRLNARLVANGGNCLAPSWINWAHYVHAAHRSDERGWRAGWAWDQRRRERLAFSRARLVVANSRGTRDDVIARCGAAPEKAVVRYYGTDADQFRPADALRRARARAALGLPEEGTALAFVGGLGNARKGLDVLLGAWDRLSGRVGGWDVTLLVVGRGALLPKFQELARSRTWGDSVRFLGPRGDVPEVLAACDGLASPTRYEPYGLNVHEALCMGLPVLVSALAGAAERVPEDWRLPSPEDVEDLAMKLGRWRDDLSEGRRRALAIGEELRAWTWEASFRAPESRGGWGLD